LFAGEAPAIAGEAAVLGDDAVAGDDDGNGIGGAGASDGADGFLASDGAGDLAVGARGTPGDAAEFFPDAALKSGGLDVEREIAMGLFAAKMAEDFADPGGESGDVGANLGARIFAGERGLELRLGIAEIDGADSAGCAGDEYVAERTRNDGVMNLHACTSVAICPRRHAHLRRGAFVKTAAGTESGVVHGGSQFFAVAQTGFELGHAARVGELARAYAKNFAKCAIDLVGAEAEGAGEFGES